MAPIDMAIVTLLFTAMIFSTIELSLSAYYVSVWKEVYYPGGVPAPFSLLLFASVWTLFITAFRIILQLVRGNSVPDKPGGAVKTLVVNAVTMIFWLGAFATLAKFLSGFWVVGITAAWFAFAILSVSCLPTRCEVIEKGTN
jgi:hypothetical protein